MSLTTEPRVVPEYLLNRRDTISKRGDIGGVVETTKERFWLAADIFDRVLVGEYSAIFHDALKNVLTGDEFSQSHRATPFSGGVDATSIGDELREIATYLSETGNIGVLQDIRQLGDDLEDMYAPTFTLMHALDRRRTTSAPYATAFLMNARFQINRYIRALGNQVVSDAIVVSEARTMKPTDALKAFMSYVTRNGDDAMDGPKFGDSLPMLGLGPAIGIAHRIEHELNQHLENNVGIDHDALPWAKRAWRSVLFLRRSQVTQQQCRVIEDDLLVPLLRNDFPKFERQARKFMAAVPEVFHEIAQRQFELSDEEAVELLGLFTYDSPLYPQVEKRYRQLESADYGREQRQRTRVETMRVLGGFDGSVFYDQAKPEQMVWVLPIDDGKYSWRLVELEVRSVRERLLVQRKGEEEHGLLGATDHKESPKTMLRLLEHWTDADVYVRRMVELGKSPLEYSLDAPRARRFTGSAIPLKQFIGDDAYAIYVAQTSPFDVTQDRSPGIEQTL